MEWFIPTFHGDISLIEREPGTTIVRTFRLTPSESKAMTNLRERALAQPWGSRAWSTLEKFPPLDSSAYGDARVEIVLDAKLATVRDFLARQLKPDRKLVNAVLFKDGTLAEASFLEGSGDEEQGTPPKPEAKPPVEPRVAPPQPSRRPAAGATVAQPTLGCPAPDFSPAEVRARQVLSRFLTPQQESDFLLHDRFITVGTDTGHRYMLTSRTNPQQLKLYGYRTMYDLDEKRAYCVHDWSVPSGEELLALHLFLTLPGHESYLRSIPE
jgi:hypothetical protein